MKKEKISIIIPVYNAEKYLEDCLSSIQMQTYTNYEVLLIDDGSNDHSLQIIQKFVKYDNRFKSIRQVHQGVSAARNLGLTNAAGEYISFIDADDRVSRFFLETLWMLLQRNRADISLCGISHGIMKKVDEKRDNFFCNSEKLTSGRQILLHMEEPFQYENTVVCWNKLYRKSILSEFKFPVGKIYEDAATIYKLLYSVKKIAVTNQKLYFYNTKSQGITRQHYQSSHLDELRFAKQKMLFFKEKTERELYFLARKQFCIELYKHYCLIWLCKDFDNKSKMLLKINNQIQKYCSGLSWKKNFGKAFCIAITVGKRCPFLIGETILLYERILEAQRKR